MNMRGKKYLYLGLILLINYVHPVCFPAPLTITTSRSAIKYDGESDYRIYEFTPVSATVDVQDPTYTHPAALVVNLSDSANGLPSGIITEIKFYITAGASSGWIKFGAPVTFQAQPADGTNYLSSNLDLATIKRRKVTLKFNGAPTGPVIRTSVVENL